MKNLITDDIKSSQKVIEQAKKFLGDSFDFSGKTDRQIKSAVIKKACPELDVTNKSDAYIDAFYETTINLTK